MNRLIISGSLFSIVLGLCGLAQAWNVAVQLWHVSALFGEIIAISATLIWSILLIVWLIKMVRIPHDIAHELRQPLNSGTLALPASATFLMVQTTFAWSHSIAWFLLGLGMLWHLTFSLWHTGAMWKGGHASDQITPALYLPTVGGNFTAAFALATVGQPDWAWLFLGAGVCSWLALEPLILRRVHTLELAAAQRPLLGIQFAPSAVCAAALIKIDPATPTPWLLMLLGYALFQFTTALRIADWMSEPTFAPQWWSYTFGLVTATTVCLKLALQGVHSAHLISIPLFVAVNLFTLWLTINLLFWVLKLIPRPKITI
jgi:tellurite resistance protein